MVPLAAHAFVGSYARYVADDYCTSGILAERGLMGSQVYWYTAWSGRFSFYFTVNLLELIGPAVVPYLPAAALMLWLGAATLCIKQWTGFRSPPSGSLLAFILAEVLLVGTFDAAPNVYQSLYWQTGMLTYSFPLILFTATLAISGWARTREMRSPAMAVAILSGFLLALVIGGYSETIVSVQTAALILLLALVLWNPQNQNRGPLRTFTISCLIGSLIAMAIVIAAPGNAARQAEMPPPPNLLTLIYLSNRYALAFSAKAVLASPLTALLCGAAAFMVGGLWARRHGEASLFNLAPRGGWEHALPIILPATLGYALILATTAPYVYTIGIYPDDRVLVTAQYILNSTLALCGFQFGMVVREHPELPLGHQVLSSRYLPFAVLVIALGSSLWATQRIWRRAPELRDYAHRWDQRHAEIQRAVSTGATELTVERLPRLADLGDVSKDPERWINICIARAYGLESIQRR